MRISEVESPPALLAEATRGPAVESRHFGHAVVVDTRGRVLWAAGNPDHPTFPRSSLKPLQALAGLARGTAERFALTDAEIAVICASHTAGPRHLETVARLLEKIGATEADLRCGPHPVADPATRERLLREGREPTPIHNNCSGKHAGLLALARQLGAPLEGYWRPEHPVQREVRRILALACDADPDRLEWGIDGCGIPTWRLPLRSLALGFARLAVPECLPRAEAAAARRIVAAMTAEPEMVRGEGGLDTLLLRALPGVLLCKGGAEGCEAAALLREGLGLAIKIEDGAGRPLGPVLLALARRWTALPDPLPEPLARLAEPPVENTRGEVVGTLRPCL